MRFGSLFAGIGGLDRGLARAGMEVKWQVEIDPYCRKVLAKHWPDAKGYEDVREVGAHNLEPVDLICGGFPCQDISNAGKRAGIEGKRSGMWSEFYRIICELRPRFVLVENVRALLVRGIDRVLGDLAYGGYDAEWDCIPAAAVGAPHVRYRVFIVAHRNAIGIKQGALGGEAAWSSTKPDRDCEDVADADSRGLTRRGEQDAGGRARGRPQCEGWWSTEPGVGRVAHGVSRRVDRLRGLGNAVVPQVAEWIGRRIIAAQ